MLDSIGAGTATALVGLVGGLMLGLAARLGRFCTLGAIEDYLYQESDVRLRMWGVAIGVAVVGVALLMGAGAIVPAETLYLGQAWMPLASIAGGLTFGYGMALAGNCGFGALARLGGGDLRAFVIVMVMGVASATIAVRPHWRTCASGSSLRAPPATCPPGIAHGLAEVTGLAAPAIAVVIGLAILLFALSARSMIGKPRAIFWGVVVGLAIVSGWAGTAWVAHESFGETAVVSHTFSAPLGETMIYAMTSSGNTLSFGVGSVAGVLAGAFIGSLFKGHFRWEACEDPRELRRQILGAALMGVGAVVAAGCTVGQGISAFALLAYSAPVTVLAILAGAALGLRQQVRGLRRA
ncbi:MAG: YeeE/YedE family protein [Paracoccaceae bacterium]